MNFFLETVICISISVLIFFVMLCASFSYYKMVHNPVEHLIQEFVIHSTGINIEEIIDDETFV